MMSRLLSQIFDRNSASVYEALQRHDDMTSSESGSDDLEERAGLLPVRTVQSKPNFGLRRLGRRFGTVGERADAGASTSNEGHFPEHPRQPPDASPSPLAYEEDEENAEVPPSLLFETPGDDTRLEVLAARPEPRTPGWERSSGHSDDPPVPAEGSHLKGTTKTAAEAKAKHGAYRPLGLINPKERALWKWANVENLDTFLSDVYLYFVGKGIFNILLLRLLNMLTLAFVVSFSTFLSLCVDYTKVHKTTSKSLADIVIPHCVSRMSGTATALLWGIAFFWFYKLVTYVLDIGRLLDIYNFYTYLLEIPDSDMQTISWQEVVARLMVLRDANPNTSDALRRRNYRHSSKQRMDAHDIANRVMRRENYLIALFNKDILDLTIPLPFLRRRGGMLTRTLEWNLSQCILDFVFNEQGQFRTLFLRDTHRRMLSDGLRRRFIFAGFMNFVFAPFIVTYFVVLFLLQNLHDFIKTPARIGHRQYTPLAEWKFREFNELWHLFQMRLNMSYPVAEAYVQQFPKEKTAHLARFTSFVASSLLGVLAIAMLVDQELTTNFEIYHGLTALSCVGILTTIVAISRGMLPDDNTVYDPEWSIRNVIQQTHYMPASWKDRLHSDDVKREFMKLYTLKVSIFVEEILSVILTPFVLWFSLPSCSERIIDFFREFTVHVDGVGYVCSFAVFEFHKPGRHNVEDLREEYFATKDNKMMASYLGFMDQYHPSAVNRNMAGRRQVPLAAHQYAGLRVPLTEATTQVRRVRNPKVPISHPSTSTHGISSAREQAIYMKTSGIRSSLLDHQHQPGPLPSRIGTLALSRTVPEQDEEASLTGTRDNPTHGSPLGESFVSADMADPETTEEGFPGGGAGVLELLNRFVGAHGGAEKGRRTVI